MPVRPTPIWIGAERPRMLALTGRLADGWSVSRDRVGPRRVPELASRIDDAAVAAGRDPSEVRRLYNVSGIIATRRAARGRARTAPDWADKLAEYAVALGFDAFVFWPERDPQEQLRRFADDVVPMARRAAAERFAGSRHCSAGTV